MIWKPLNLTKKAGNTKFSFTTRLVNENFSSSHFDVIKTFKSRPDIKRLFFSDFMGIFIFSKIFAFCPNLLIFFQWKLKVHTFRILSCARRRAHARAPILLWMLEIHWKSQNRRIFRKCGFGARECARACAHDKIWKVWIVSFHWKKKIIKFG